jgi:PPOX class probable F420-dependent enzyme
MGWPSATANHVTPARSRIGRLVSLSPSELDEFLNRTRPALLGTVGTLRANGSPHVVPVWYRWDGEAVHIWSDEGRGWVRNVLRDPRVAFSVQEPQPPFAAVVMHGRAESHTSDTDDVSAEIRRITLRYIEEAEADEYVAGWARLQTVVTIRPGSISSWRRGY